MSCCLRGSLVHQNKYPGRQKPTYWMLQHNEFLKYRVYKVKFAWGRGFEL